MPILSKSKFVSGIQCQKKLYFDFYRKDLKPPLTEAQKALFASGHNVGELAQKVFPGGKDATPESYRDFSQSIRDTARWIKEGAQTIYEAAFSKNGAFAALDILHHKDGERWAIEVKSSTSVKDYHLTDAALQYWVMEQSGARPDRFFLMHINNAYVKNGSIEPEKLFTLSEITDQVIENQILVQEKLPELAAMLQNKQEPDISIGAHCSNPFACDYQHHCWQHVPEKSVFELYRTNGKSWDFYKRDILRLADIPENEPLSHRQQLQVNGARTGSDYTDPLAIQDFLKDWEYPLYFFDFETLFPSLPLLDGTRPYQQVPFQYSLHIIAKPGAKPEHKAFLAQPEDYRETATKDPTSALLDQIKQDIGTEGSIVAYNASFEKRILNFLGDRFPEEAAYIENLNSRFVDLLVPFRSGWYYRPEMNGSASIKAVLPALVPEMSYSNLEISNGDMASSTFEQMIYQDHGDAGKIRQNLLEYCEQDTLAMVKIWERLLEEIH